MIRNYIVIAWRNLVRNKAATAINFFGLTTGMTCFALIAFYIQYELSYDTQHEKFDRIYRVAQIQKGNSFRGTDRFARSPLPFAQTVMQEFPEVEVASALQVQEMSLESDGRVFLETGLFADEHLFDVFTFPLIAGNGKEALKQANSIILTESLARKYFGGKDPMGKILHFQNDRLLTVRGIVKDVPKNQHFTFQCIASIKNLPFYKNDGWNSNEYLTYLVLPENYDYKDLEKKFVSLNKYLGAYDRAPFRPEFFLQPLRDIHLHSNINFEIGANSDIRYIWLSVAIALIILLLASINYINLTTAVFSLRAKEVGVRKVLGVQKGQLVLQFLCESFLLTTISFVLALALVNVVLTSFNQLFDLSIPFSIMGHPWVVIGMLAICLLIGCLSGLYPGLFMSALLPVKALRGSLLKGDNKGSLLRNILVVGQFTSSIILGIGSIIIFQQLEFIQTKKLGYNREHVVYLQYNNVDISGKIETIRTELLRNPQIEKVSFPTYMPLNMISENVVDNWEGNSGQEKLWIYCNYVDPDFLDLFEIQLAQGRNFSAEYSSDASNSYILNETAVKALGWKSALGKQFRYGTVIGVVKDFHFQPLDLTIKPLFLVSRSTANFDQDNIAVKIRMEEVGKTIAFIQQTVRNQLPHVFSECRFMETDYDSLYKSERRFGQLFNLFTVLALTIACMGLFGLVSHHVLQRTKEIGIRKVLGSTTAGIVHLVSKDFLKLVTISVVIASPIAWWAMLQWLQEFAYKIEIEWWVFVLSGLGAVGIALLTVSAQSIKAASANPVDSLRSE